MKPRSNTDILNLIIGILLFGAAMSKFNLFGIQFDTIYSLLFFLIIGMSFISRYFLKQNKKAIDTTKMILVVSWCIFNSFLLSSFVGVLIHVIVLMILGSIWLFQEFIQQVKEPKKHIQFNWLRNIGLAFLIIRFLFVIQHWPFAGPVMILSTIGYILVGISFIKEFKINTVYNN